MSVLSLPEKPATEQIEAIEKGLPSTSLNQIATALKIPKALIIAALRLAPRTVTLREKPGNRFTLEESERILRVIRMRHILGDVFTSDSAIAGWLNAPDSSLGGKTPLQMLATDVGAAKVENRARAMIHGVPV